MLTQPESAPDVFPLPDSDLTPVVGATLRRLRVKRGLSLERLARVSGVSRAMLGQIELGKSTPTINVLFRLGPGDAIFFEADVPHEYQNSGQDEVAMYLVMTYT